MLKRIVPAALVVVFAACEDPAPLVPFEVVAVTPNPAPSAVVGTQVGTGANAITFEVRTESGKIVKNVPLAIAVTSGGGSIANAPGVTAAGGPTEIGTWTLGTTAGAQSLTVTAEDLTPLVFTINTTPGPVDEVLIVTGQNQRAPESGTIPNPIQVLVRDQYDNGIPGVTVNWQVTLGGGLVANPSSVTNASGVATAPAWTLGLESAGAQQLRATVGALTQNFNAVVQEDPASITVDVAPPGSSAVGAALATAPTFAVRDSAGNVLSGIPVTVSVTAGGGSLTSAPTMSGGVPISIGTWTLGTAVGTQTVTIEVAGIPNALVTTNAVAGPPQNILVVSGGGQSAVAGASLGDPVRVRVRDQYNNPIIGVGSSWTVEQGGGELTGVVPATDGSGEVNSPSWKLGKNGGPQRIKVTAGGASLEIPATIQTGYEVILKWTSALPDPVVEAAFNNAKNRIEAAITGSLSAAVLVDFNANACVANQFITDTIVGVYIFVAVENIDGPGAVLGSAGPCFLRNAATPVGQGPNLTVIGRMRFDAADMANMISANTLESVILHEMMHVVGIGTLWGTLGLRSHVASTTTPGTLPRFLGPLATDACIDFNGGATACSAGPPIEDCTNLMGAMRAGCGSGTINAHWHENVFQLELMTGFASPGVNPFSRFTLESLTDMGYTTNALTVDDYMVPSSLMGQLLREPVFRLGDPTGPIGEIDSRGQIIRMFPRQ